MKSIDIRALSEKEKEVTLKNAKMLQILNNPTILQFKDIYITKKSKLRIVMEYADGGNLFMKIKGQKGQLFPESQILDWFTQICLSVKHVHDHKILHRDLKALNIYFTNKNTIKLGGFDLAIFLSNTIYKNFDGYYLSPEIIESKPYSYSSDIWSLGVILYEMCTLKPPFDADSLHFLALKIAKGEYAPISSVYSKDLQNLIQQMLNLNPYRRPNINQILSVKLISKGEHKNNFVDLILDNQKIKMKFNSISKDNNNITYFYPWLLVHQYESQKIVLTIAIIKQKAKQNINFRRIRQFNKQDVTRF